MPATYKEPWFRENPDVPVQIAPLTDWVEGVYCDEQITPRTGFTRLKLGGKEIWVPPAFPDPIEATLWLLRLATKLGLDVGTVVEVERRCECDAMICVLEAYCSLIGIDERRFKKRIRYWGTAGVEQVCPLGPKEA